MKEELFKEKIIKISRRDLERYKTTINVGTRNWIGTTRRVVVYCPFHPNSHGRGYVYLHRLVKEVEIGRYLEKDEFVHHIDGNTKNWKHSNLKIEIESKHQRKHALDQGQKWYGFNCPICEMYFERRAGTQNVRWKRGSQGPFCSQPCANKVRIMIGNGEYFEKTKIVRRFKKFSKNRYHLKNNLA